MERVGTLEFSKEHLDVYSNLDIPLFKADDLARILRCENADIIEKCEYDEWKTIDNEMYVTELGLYDVLSQSKKLIARKWRRVIHQQIIEQRKARNLDILEQFEDWDALAETIYFDEETGCIMQSITVAGGDVDQVIFEGNFEDYLK